MDLNSYEDKSRVILSMYMLHVHSNIQQVGAL